MCVALKTEERMQQVAIFMGQEVDTGIFLSQPARQEVNSERKAIHFRKQGNDKC